MSLTIFLDSGPLGLITNPKTTRATIDILAWTDLCPLPSGRTLSNRSGALVVR